MRIVATALVASLLSSAAGAGTIVVHPLDSIQAAIDQAVDGDVVLVDAGSYNEGIDFKGKAIRVQGAGAATTTISAHLTGKDAVSFVHGEGPASILSGFTVTGTTGLHNGIRCSAASPRIEKCRIYGNGSVGNPGGGGIDVLGVPVNGAGPLVVSNCEISFNRGSLAGGICARFTPSLRIEDCSIHANTSPGRGGVSIAVDAAINVVLSIERTSIVDNVSTTAGSGGGAYVALANATSLTLDACTISGNGTASRGGGLFLDVRFNKSVPAVIRNCVFRDNHAASSGGAIFADMTGMVASAGSLRIQNCTIVGNSAPSGAGIGANVNSAADLRIANSILRDPAGTEIATDVASPPIQVASCDVAGGYAGTGNFDVDPLFVDAAGGDMHLPIYSPCVDAGDASLAAGIATDYEGDPRITGGAIDVGADERYPHLYYVGSFEAGSTSYLRVIGEPGSLPVIYFVSLTLAPAPIPTAFGPFVLGFPLALPPLDLGMTDAGGVLDLPIIVPAGLPAGLTIHSQAYVGPPTFRLTADAALTLP